MKQTLSFQVSLLLFLEIRTWIVSIVSATISDSCQCFSGSGPSTEEAEEARRKCEEAELQQVGHWDGPTGVLGGGFNPYLGVSKNRGTPKWMVYNGKPY